MKIVINRSSWILVLLSSLIFGCKQVSIIQNLSKVEIPDDRSARGLHLFQSGSYVYRVSFDTTKLEKQVLKEDRRPFSLRVKENHIAGSIWFLDSIRFIHISEYYNTGTEISKFFNLNSKFHKGTYHLGFYERDGDELILHHQVGNSKKNSPRIFDIRAAIKGDSLQFIHYKRRRVEYKRLPHSFFFEELFTQAPTYVFDSIPKTVELYPGFFIDQIDISTSPPKFFVSQQTDSLGKMLTYKMKVKAEKKAFKAEKKQSPDQ